MITLEGAGKRYGTVKALSGVDMEVPSGATVAILGPNGSGKSTLLRLVAGLAVPTSGRVTVAGTPPRAAKARIGYLGHEPFLYRYLSATENLRFYADLYRVERSRIPALLDEVDLARKGEALVRTFSRGEAQRLGLARALLHDPDYLLLDEPFSGLDSDSADRLPLTMARPGRTVLFSTHDRDRAGSLADRMVFLKEGRLV